MTKYEELTEALAVWNKAVHDYDVESMKVTSAFLKGLVDYLGVKGDRIYFFSPPGEKSKPGTTISGSRYTSKRDGYAFTPALVVTASDGHTISFQIPVEYHKETLSDLMYTLRIFSKDHKFSDHDAATFEPVYSEIFETIKRNFLKPVSPGPVIGGAEPN